MLRYYTHIVRISLENDDTHGPRNDRNPQISADATHSVSQSKRAIHDS